MLTRNLAVELGPLGIAVNAIAPAPSPLRSTPICSIISSNLNALLGQIPLGRLGKPEDVAGRAAFLARLTQIYVTGAVLR